MSGAVMFIKEVERCELQGKRRFPDEAWARMATQTHMRRKSIVPDRLYVYHCKVCDGWHATKRDLGLKWLITREKQYHAE